MVSGVFEVVELESAVTIELGLNMATVGPIFVNNLGIIHERLVFRTHYGITPESLVLRFRQRRHCFLVKFY